MKATQETQPIPVSAANFRHTKVHDNIHSMPDLYSWIWKFKKAHSPIESTQSLARRAQPFIGSLGKDDVVLDLGSGPQNFENESFRIYGKPQCKVLTLDYSDIEPHKLLAKNVKNVHHTRADGRRLPLQDESVSVIVSNMAIDFMTEDAIKEMFRVLKPGGRVFANLCYPALDVNLIPDLDSLKRLRKNKEISPARITELLFWREYLTKNSVLMANQKEVHEVFGRNGFDVSGVQEIPNSQYNWCEANLVKPTLDKKDVLAEVGNLVFSKLTKAQKKDQPYHLVSNKEKEISANIAFAEQAGGIGGHQVVIFDEKNLQAEEPIHFRDIMNW